MGEQDKIFQNQIRQYYEQNYPYQPASKGIIRVRSNLQGMHIWPGMRILDIGCGTGAAGLYLSAKKAIVVGIDLSWKAVRSALSESRCAGLLQGDAHSLPLKSCSFDGAILMGTLEHFSDPSRALDEIKRVLKPGSQICFVVPNSQFFLFQFLKGTGQPYEVARTLLEWKALFWAAGLNVEKVYRDIGPGVCQGNVFRGILRKGILLFSRLLPIEYTYQFVFICRVAER